MFKPSLEKALWFAAGLILAIGITSRAEPYLTVGLGQGELRHPGSNMWWVQDGWNYTIDAKSTVWNFGVGWKFSKYLAAEINYHDLGEYHHFAGFMTDESKYIAWTPTHCAGACDPTQWGYLSGSATAISASILPRYPISENLSIFARWGLAYVDAKFKAYITPIDNNAKNYEIDDIFSQKMVRKFFGFGVTYKRLTFEMQEFPQITAQGNGCCSAYKSARTKTISYRWDL